MTRPRPPFRQGDRVRLLARMQGAVGRTGTVARADRRADGTPVYWLRLPDDTVMPCREDQLQLIRRVPPPPGEGDWVKVIDPRRAAYGGTYVVVRISAHAHDPDYWLGGTGYYSWVFSLPFRQDQLVVVRRAPTSPATPAAAPTETDRRPADPPPEDSA